MDEPRWTIEDDPTRIVYGSEVWLAWDDIPAPAVVSDRLRRAGFDALVAAVRDADTLRKMRRTLEAAYNAWLEAVEQDEDDGTVERLFARLIQQIHPILLPEVIPPVPESGEET